MEPESSWPYSQVSATSPYPEPNPSSPHNSLPLPAEEHELYCKNNSNFLSYLKQISALRLQRPIWYRCLF
jgi:hypothetical protein